MDATKAMVQFLFWTIFIVGFIALIGAWYLLVGLIGVIVGIWIYFARQRQSKNVRSNISASSDSDLELRDVDVAMLERGGFLSMEQGTALRVVETSRFIKNHVWLAEKYQVEKAETLQLEGAVVAGAEWVESPAGGIEREVLFVTAHKKKLGLIPEVDLGNWYDEVLEVGGAAKCLLDVSFSEKGEIRNIQVRGQRLQT